MQWFSGQILDGELDLAAFMELVQKVQSKKLKWSEHSDRRSACELALRQVEGRIEELVNDEATTLGVSAEELMPEVLGCIESLKFYINNYDQSHYFPRGVLLAMLPKSYGLCSFLYMSILGALYGNTLIIKWKNAHKAIEVLKGTELSDNLNMITKATPEAFEMLCSHPFLNTIVFMGKKQNWDTLNTNQKQCVAGFDSINTHIVLKDADLKVAAQHISHEFLKWNGLSLFKPHRVLVATPVFEEFKKQMLESFELHKVIMSEPYKSRFEADVLELKKDTHNKLFESEGMYIAADLTYCSTYQETEVQGGFLSLSEFKYNHEAAKWVNVASRHRLVSLWTQTPEKTEKLLTKINAPIILINKARPSGHFQLPLVSSGDGMAGGGVGHWLSPEQLFALKRNIETA